jgi:hypothetical protein
MNWIQLVLGIIQVIPNLITAIEPLFGPGTGTQKKAAVVTVATSTASVSGASPEQVQALSNFVGTIVDTTVSSLNAAGVFKKSTQQ